MIIRLASRKTVRMKHPVRNILIALFNNSSHVQASSQNIPKIRETRQGDCHWRKFLPFTVQYCIDMLKICARARARDAMR